MPKLTLRNNPDLRQIEKERNDAFRKLSGEERIKEMFKLIEFTMMLHPDMPYKKPTGKGLVMRKPDITER